MLKFFKNPFAIIGTRAPIPAADPGTGEVNYPLGFTPQYQLPKTDPLSRNIPRDQTNQLYFDLTNELKLLQEHGVPDFITTALNEGAAKSYGIGDRVRYDDGTATRVYESRVNANTALPTVAASWKLVQAGTPFAVAAGTANALTAAFSPSLYSLTNGLLVLVEHTATNTGPATLAVDGGAALPVTKANGVALSAGDIAGANSWGLYAYDTSLAGWVLLNPADRSLGVGQTWQTFTGSRATNTTYTNTTGRSIEVAAHVTLNNGQAVDLAVGGITTNYQSNAQVNPNATGVIGVIPPGATYRLNTPGALNNWSELRV